MIAPLPPRVAGWRSRLIAWLSSIADVPHQYGRHDCALLAAGAVQAMHGVDPAAEWRGRYTTWRGGLRVLRRCGFQDHVDVARRLGQPVAPGFVQFGDLVAVDAPGHPALGIVTGPQVALLRPEGLAFLPLVIEAPHGPVCVVVEGWRT